MKGAFLLLFLLGPAASAQPTVTVIRAGTLIDGKSPTARRDQVIVIRGNRIAAVEDAARASIPTGAAVIDLSRATVLPGLIDCHTPSCRGRSRPREVTTSSS